MQRFACLMYHYLSDCEHGDLSASQYTIPLRGFREQLALLKAEGVVAEDFVGIQQRIDRAGALPERYAVLSFDDGDRSNLAAAEALAAFGYRATFFIVTGPWERGGARALGKAGVRQLVQAGHSVGSHSVTHRPLTALALSELTEELSSSRKWLEDVTGKAVDFLSAPQGYLSKRVLREASRQGYRLVGNSAEWPNKWPLREASVEISRLSIRARLDAAAVARIVAGDTLSCVRGRCRRCVLAIPKAIFRSELIEFLGR